MDIGSVAQAAFGGDAPREPAGVRVVNGDSPTLQKVATAVRELRGRASSAASRSGSDMRAIEDDPNLSDEGKQNARADLAAADTKRMKSLRDEELSILNTEIGTLERKLDGQIGYASTDIIAFRDAQDRAERLHDADEALRVMERAIRTQDRTLAYAVYRRAIDAGYRQVLAPFAAAYPDAAEAMNDLAAIRRLRDEGGMQRAMAYSSATTFSFLR